MKNDPKGGRFVAVSKRATRPGEIDGKITNDINANAYRSTLHAASGSEPPDKDVCAAFGFQYSNRTGVDQECIML